MTSKDGIEKKNAYKILIRKTERGKPLGRTKCGWKENNLLQYMVEIQYVRAVDATGQVSALYCTAYRAIAL